MVDTGNNNGDANIKQKQNKKNKTIINKKKVWSNSYLIQYTRTSFSFEKAKKNDLISNEWMMLEGAFSSC